MSDKNRGLYEKFHVIRTDGRSNPGQKHARCRYFVLDLDHDPFAIEAIAAYAEACQETLPALAKDLDAWLETKMVECPGCSEAGGADRSVKHLPPICK